MGTKYFRYQNQELIHFDQVLKGEAVTLSNKDFSGPMFLIKFQIGDVQ